MTGFRLLIPALSACSVACGSAASAPTSPTPAAPVSYVVSGVVSETVNGASRPVAGRNVHLWVAKANGGGSTLVTTTDERGRYVANVPPSRVYASAWNPPDHQQPCVASTEVRGDTTLDVLVVRTGTPVSALSLPGPIIDASVYETTPQGRIPVSGAYVSVDIWPFQDVYVAATRSDEGGRFVLCRMNTSVGLIVSAIGYKAWMREIPGVTSDTQLEIALTR